MAEEHHVSHFAMHIDGATASKEVMDQLLDCVIENSLHLPDVCTIRIHHGEAGKQGMYEFIDSPTFAVGKSIKITGGEGPSADSTLFEGEITGLELDLAAHGVPTLVVRCFDKSHRLHRGRHSRSFVQMTDSDIVKKVGAEAGLSVQAESTSEVHDWVMQNNQTNWEFLQERAARNGFRLFVSDGDKLYFKKVKDNGQTKHTIEWGKELRSFRPRVSASPQVDEVEVRGWDPKKKETIVGTAKVAQGVPQVRQDKQGGPVASRAFGNAKMVVVDRPVHSEGEAKAIAQSLCDEIGGSFLEAEGLCYGVPQMRAEDMVKIDNIGQRFSGEYLVTSCQHTYTPAEGYATVFTCSGKKPQTLLSVLEGDELTRRAPIGGNIVVAVVTDNNDPDNQARIKVKYPWLTEEHQSFWARIATPMAGPERGMVFLPEVDDEVLVAFEHGDIRRPYVIGCLWNGKDKPPKTRQDSYSSSKSVNGGKTTRRWIRTRMGHILEFFDDCDGKVGATLRTAKGYRLQLRENDERIEVITKNKHMMLLDDKNDIIRVVDKTNENHIKIATSDNSILVESKGDITVKSKQGNITLDAMKKVVITAKQGIEATTPQQVKIEGTAGFSIKTTASGSVEAAILNLKASATGTLDGGGMLTVKGGLVRIN
jgi:phage protein D